MRIEQSVLATFLTALIFGLGLTLAADAATKRADGEILAVDAAASTITVRIPAPVTSSPTDLMVKVDGKTRIDDADGKSIGLEDLKQGDKVSVAYRTEAGKPVATTIDVHEG